MSCNQNTKACGGCPFSRKSPPGELGGSPIHVYLGQIMGPFFLPCHAAANYQGNATQCTSEHAQCAGAAIFRRKLGVQVPDPLLKLENDDSNVFDTVEEFIRHHAPDMSDGEVRATAILCENRYFLLKELQRAHAKGASKSVEEAQRDYDAAT